MWLPASEDEIVRAVNAPGGLVETDSFDAKAELPKKSMDLATDGSVPIVGISESVGA